jgi:hypothetical protein
LSVNGITAASDIGVTYAASGTGSSARQVRLPAPALAKKKALKSAFGELSVSSETDDM